MVNYPLHREVLLANPLTESVLDCWNPQQSTLAWETFTPPHTTQQICMYVCMYVCM